MKSYTDLEQSKKLAEIFPNESADMWWNYYSVTTDSGTTLIFRLNTPWVGSFNWNNKPDNIPCWSLAALYALLPEKTDISKAYSDDCATIVYWCWTEMSESEDECGTIIETANYDNPIDACYEMVIKLHEQNLL